jgi:hypothetical protein
MLVAAAFSAGGDGGRKSLELRPLNLTIDANTGRPAQSELGILVAVVTGNFLHEHHNPAPHGGIINSHERSDQP